LDALIQWHTDTLHGIFGQGASAAPLLTQQSAEADVHLEVKWNSWPCPSCSKADVAILMLLQELQVQILKA